MSETKETSLFTEITAEESASVNGAHYYNRNCYRPRPRPCYSYSPYFDGRRTDSYVSNYGYGRRYYD
jgi:hypothetical protein